MRRIVCLINVHERRRKLLFLIQKHFAFFEKCTPLSSFLLYAHPRLGLRRGPSEGGGEEGTAGRVGFGTNQVKNWH